MDVENLKQIHQEYQWYLQHEKRLTYDTCQLYKTISEQFLQYVKNNSEKLYLKNNWTLNDLTGRMVQVFLDYHSNKREWQDATYSSYEKSLRSFFRYLNAIDLIDKNPLQNFKFRDLRISNEFIKKNFDPNDTTKNPMDQSFDLIGSCISKIYNEDEVWAAADCSKKELNDFLDSMNSNQFKEVEKFFETMPKLSHTVKVTNPKTKVESDVVLEGLASFFG